ncbi:MAG: cupin domain-containing protein [Gemmatimonadaceae bacterium]
MKQITLAVLVIGLVQSPLRAQGTAAEHGTVIVVPAGTAKFGPAPDILPSGAKLAVLEGDPTKEGSYTMRLWMPNGYTIPPHFHLADEHVTVVEGTFLVGMGSTLDASKFAALPAGSFGMLPPHMQHYARARGVTVIQLHGMGPWGLTYVHPSDDPRKHAR